MEYSAIPLFKSHYSLGKSILTLAKAGSSEADEPSSILDIAKKLKLENLYLVDDSISGFLEAYKSCEDAKINLRFGLRLTICDDIDNKTADSRGSEANSRAIRRIQVLFELCCWIYKFFR